MEIKDLGLVPCRLPSSQRKTRTMGTVVLRSCKGSCRRAACSSSGALSRAGFSYPVLSFYPWHPNIPSKKKQGLIYAFSKQILK